MNDTHLTISDLARREGVPANTVYAWNAKRTGPRYIRVGRHVRYRLADVIAWENAHAVDPRVPA
jgi:predicted DNA-binding transcriptional regulator AlpA